MRGDLSGCEGFDKLVEATVSLGLQLPMEGGDALLL